MKWHDLEDHLNEESEQAAFALVAVAVVVAVVVLVVIACLVAVYVSNHVL